MQTIGAAISPVRGPLALQDESGKMEKETIKDYINTTRTMLRKNLTNEARKRDLSEVSDKYETEVTSLKKAQEDFEEDY